MKQKLRLGNCYALTKHKPKYLKIRYISLLAALTIMCLYARAQRPATAGPVLSGIVTDTTGTAIRGATITIRGTNTKTITDRDGRFSIQAAKASGTLAVSYLGHQTIKEPFDERGGEFHFVLVPVENMLEEVEVSTGYQTIPKERATGSFEVVDNKLFNRRVSTDIISRLEDVVSGISSSKISSSNRGQVMNIYVRGTSTMRSQRWPLIVMDGFPYYGDFNNINPNDVENVTVLKDAAAASIWGAAAGNGVIVITTKKGRYNSPLSVDFNTNVTVANKPNLYYMPQMASDDYINVEQMLYDQGFYDGRINDIWRSLSPVVQILDARDKGQYSDAEADAKIDLLRDIDMRDDFLKYIYRNPVKQQYNLSVKGGGDQVTFFVSGGYDKNRNELVTSAYNRVTLNTALSARLLSKLQLNVRLQYVKSSQKEPSRSSPIAYDLMGAGAGNYPYLSLADADGQPLAVDAGALNPIFRDTFGFGQLLDWQYRPLAELHSSSFRKGWSESLSSINAGYEISSGLHISAQYEYRNAPGQNTEWESLGSFTQRHTINYYAVHDANGVQWNVPVGDVLWTENSNSVSHQGGLKLDVKKSWGKHSFNAIAGAELRDVSANSHSYNLWGYNPDNLTFVPVDFTRRLSRLNGNDSPALIRSGYSLTGYSNRYTSLFFNAGYHIANKYAITASMRKDASNLFGVKSNDKGQPFWSIGTAWVLSNERFYNWSAMPFLKLRITYGYNGNVNNNISGLPIIAYENSPDPITGLSYASMQTPPNPSLRWEKVAAFNVGLNFRTHNDRISGELEYYKKRSTDLIFPHRIDPTTGFISVNGNNAALRTNGIDLNLTARNLRAGSFEWTSNIVASYSSAVIEKAMITNTVGSNYIVSTSAGIMLTPIEGNSPYGVYSYKWAGLDPATGDPMGFIDGAQSKDYIALYNSDLAELDYHGSAWPVYFGSVRNSFSYRNFELSINVAFQAGHFFMRRGLSYYNLFENGMGTRDFSKRWQKPGDERTTDVPSMTYPANYFRDLFYGNSSALVESASHVKLRDIRFSVNVPNAGMFGMQRLDVYAYASNIGMVWRANKSGIDPEYGTSYPDPFSVAIGMNCSF